MAHLAQLPNKIMAGMLLVFSVCIQPEEHPAFTTPVLLNTEQPGLKIKGGLMMENDRLFTGTLYTLFPGTTDTAILAGYMDGREDGEWKKFYPDCRLKEIRYFKNGQKTGSYTAWWENGRRQLEYFFNEDEYQGSCREWNEEGRLVKKMNYTRGYEDGPQQCWYDDGNIKANYIMKNGRRYGLLGTKNCVNVTDSIFSK